MTIAADIAKLGNYDDEDIGNHVTQAFKLLRIFFGGTLVEDQDENWDVIATNQAIYLLDRTQLQRGARQDPTIIVPPLLANSTVKMIEELRAVAAASTTPEVKVTTDSQPPKTNQGEHWSDPVI